MKLRLDAHPHNAPCCVKLAMVSNHIPREIAPSILFQVDTDFPAVASLFGWRPMEVLGTEDCDHEGTDGTVDCQKCKLKSTTFIAHARNWLDDCDGRTCENPGYDLI